MTDIQSVKKEVISINKREDIIEAAIELFTEKGLEKTKIADIVKQANIAQGTFYLYFSSKLSVMPAIAEVMVEKIHTELIDSVKQDASFTEQIKQIVQTFFVFTKKYERIQALVYAGIASTEHLRNWESIYNPLYNWVDTILRNAANQGDIEAVNDETAKLLIGLIESSAEQAYLYDDVSETIAQNKQQAIIPFLLNALGANE